MNIVGEKWYEVSEKFCEHFDIGNGSAEKSKN